MEEKNSGKITAGTYAVIVTIVFLVLLVGILGGMLIQKNNVTTNVANENKENLVTNNTDKNETQKLVKNEIKENNTNTKSEEINSTEKTFSNAEIKKVMQKCLNLESAKTKSTYEALITLGFYKEENLQAYIDKEKPAQQPPFVKTPIKYIEFKNKILKYMTEDCYQEHWNDFFKNENGYLCYNNVGATGVEYKVNSIKKAGDYYIANVTATSEGPDDEMEIRFKIDDTKCVVDFYEFK